LVAEAVEVKVEDLQVVLEAIQYLVLLQPMVVEAEVLGILDLHQEEVQVEVELKLAPTVDQLHKVQAAEVQVMEIQVGEVTQVLEVVEELQVLEVLQLLLITVLVVHHVETI
jgi:RNA-binding protein YlmH